jgi:hypothetical protein
VYGFEQAALAVPVRACEDDEAGRKVDVGISMVAETT